VAIQANAIKLTHKVVGRMHVYQSPDVPELYTAHQEQDSALLMAQPMLDALERMQQRQQAISNHSEATVASSR
jgi:hypothetical protein